MSTVPCSRMSQKLLQDWSSFVPGKALDFSNTVSDCHRIKSCIAANKECGIKTLRVTLSVFYPASLGPRVWRQVRAQHWSNPQISCSEEALQKIWGREDMQFVHVYKVYWYILNHDWSWKWRKVWKMSHDVFFAWCFKRSCHICYPSLTDTCRKESPKQSKVPSATDLSPENK